MPGDRLSLVPGQPEVPDQEVHLGSQPVVGRPQPAQDKLRLAGDRSSIVIVNVFIIIINIIITNVIPIIIINVIIFVVIIIVIIIIILIINVIIIVIIVIVIIIIIIIVFFTMLMLELSPWPGATAVTRGG